MKPFSQKSIRTSIILERDVLRITYPRSLSFQNIQQTLRLFPLEREGLPKVRIHDLRNVQTMLFGAEELYPLVELVRALPGLSKALVIWVVTQVPHRALVELYRSMVRPWGLTVEIVETLEESYSLAQSWKERCGTPKFVQ